MTGLRRRYSLNPVIPTERPKGATRNLQSVLRSQGEPKVPTRDPHVGHFIPSSGWRVVVMSFRQNNWRERRGIYSLFFAVTKNPKYQLWILTSFANAHSSGWQVGSVIPTEKPLGFDEESTVCTSQSRWTRSSYSRFSRRFAPQDDWFKGLMDPLRMTDFGKCHQIPQAKKPLWAEPVNTE